MTDVKWIKINTDMFSDEKFYRIDEMPEKDTILIIWIKLLTMAGRVNHGGLIYKFEDVPYTIEELATSLRRPINSVRLALQVLENERMIHKTKSEYICITNWDKHQNIDALEIIKEQNRERSVKFRLKQKERIKQIEDKHIVEVSDDSNVTVTLRNGIVTHQELELDKELDKDKIPENSFSSFRDRKNSEEDPTHSATPPQEEDERSKDMEKPLGWNKKPYKTELSYQPFEDAYIQFLKDYNLFGKDYNYGKNRKMMIELLDLVGSNEILIGGLQNFAKDKFCAENEYKLQFFKTKWRTFCGTSKAVGKNNQSIKPVIIGNPNGTAEERTEFVLSYDNKYQEMKKKLEDARKIDDWNKQMNCKGEIEEYKRVKFCEIRDEMESVNKQKEKENSNASM